jgi:type II secretory pathway component PulF
MRDLLLDLWAGLREAAHGWVETFYIKQFGKNERIQFYESLMGVLEDGIPIEEALETVEKALQQRREGAPSVSIVCGQVAMLVRGGKPVAEACRSYIPFDESSLIESGRKTGNLIQAFRDCVRIIEARQRIASLVKSVVALPSLTWSLMGALMYVIAGWMVPSMSQRQDPENWTGVPAVLYALSNLVTHYGLAIVIVTLTLVVLSITTLPYFCGLQISSNSPVMKVKFSAFLQKARIRLESIPPWSIYKVLQGSIFLLNMSVMLRAGISQLNALAILKRSAAPGFASVSTRSTMASAPARLRHCALRLSGHQFPTPWPSTSCRYLPPARAFAKSMERFANRWLEQMLKRVEAISGALVTVSAILMGLLMILVVVGIFQLALGLMDSIQH